MGEPFEGSEGGESSDRRDESLEEVRKRLGKKYPEAEPRIQDVPPGRSGTTDRMRKGGKTGDWMCKSLLMERGARMS